MPFFLLSSLGGEDDAVLVGFSPRIIFSPVNSAWTGMPSFFLRIDPVPFKETTLVLLVQLAFVHPVQENEHSEDLAREQYRKSRSLNRVLND